MEVNRLKEIENPMVIDSLWKEQEKEPEIIGTCSGCEEDILVCDDYYHFLMGVVKIVLVHQKDECCRQYIAGASVGVSAG
jgi:hypothetical protein